MTVDSRATTGARAAKAPSTSRLKLNNSLLLMRSCSFQNKHCAPAITFAPGDLGINQTCTRAHVGEASSSAPPIFVWIKVATIVLDCQYEIAIRRRRHNHFDLSGTCMAANVVRGFLCDPVNLHLHVWRQLCVFFKRVITDKIIFKLPQRRRLLDGMS